MCPTHDWNAKSQDRWRQLCFASISRGKAFPRDTRETFYSASLYYLIHTFYTHTIYTHITISTYLYTFACRFSSTPTSPFPYHLEVDSPNTYHTLSECQMRIWCYWEALEEVKDGRCNIEFVAGSGELDKTKVQRNLVRVGAWRA